MFVPVCLLKTAVFLSVLLAASLASAEEARTKRRTTLAASGDLLLHGSVVRSAQALKAEGGWSKVLEGLAKAMPHEALGIINVETPLTDSVVRPRTGGHPVLGAPPEVAFHLAMSGVDVGSLANNHAFDQDSQGLLATMTTMDRAGLTSVGTGRDVAEAFRPRIVEHEGVRVAFVAATGPMNCRHKGRGPRMFVARLRQEEQLLDATRAARDQADVVVLLLHWMWDYRRGPRRYERELAERLISAGADVLLGAGPHLLQPVERRPSARGEAIIAWSLGNLVSGMGMNWRPGWRPPPSMDPVSVLPGTRDAVVLHIDLDVSPGRIEVAGLRATPLWTLNNWLEFRRGASERHDIRLVPLSTIPEPLRSLRLEAIRRDLGPAVSVVP